MFEQALKFSSLIRISKGTTWNALIAYTMQPMLGGWGVGEDMDDLMAEYGFSEQ